MSIESEGMTLRKTPVHMSKKAVKNLSRQRDIDKMDTAHIMAELFSRHWKFLFFVASFSLNVMYFVKHFGLA